MPLSSGKPVSGSAVPVNLKGRRQEWAYTIIYAGGDTQYFNIPCVSLPFNISKTIALERLKLAIRQPVETLWASEKIGIKKNVEKLLLFRKDSDFVPDCELFLSGLPETADIPHESYINSFNLLLNEYGGKIQSRSTPFVSRRLPSDLVDSITFDGGPLSHAERIKLIQALTGILLIRLLQHYIIVLCRS